MPPLAIPGPARLGLAVLQFVVRRLVVAILVALTVLTLAFMLTRLSGDLAISIAGPNATQQDVELVRKAYGLDRPPVVQFFSWMGKAMVGDLLIICAYSQYTEAEAERHEPVVVLVDDHNRPRTAKAAPLAVARSS